MTYALETILSVSEFAQSLPIGAINTTAQVLAAETIEPCVRHHGSEDAMSVIIASAGWMAGAMAVASNYQTNPKRRDEFHKLHDGRGSEEQHKRRMVALGATAITAIPTGLVLLQMIKPFDRC